MSEIDTPADAEITTSSMRFNKDQGLTVIHMAIQYQPELLTDELIEELVSSYCEDLFLEVESTTETGDGWKEFRFREREC